MKKASGYVTDDGTFFVNESEAVLYEAEMRLRAKLRDVNGTLDARKFLDIVLATMSELKGFVDAYYTNERDQAEDEDGAEAGDSGAPASDASLGHISSTEEDLASLLKLPARGPGNVPDVGRGPRAEKVQKRRPKHGA